MEESIRIAAAYIRVSTEEQTEFSPAAQLRELRDYAAANHMILDEDHVYADEGISGRRADKRPAFQQMISDAKSKSHPFDVVLVHKFDRFARNREDSVVYKGILKRYGVEVISIKEPLFDGPYAGVMEGLYESLAEAYSKNLGQEVRKGMTERALEGKRNISPPFGYCLDKNRRMVPDPVEAPAVIRIFNDFVSGDGYYKISRWLNAHGYLTHRKHMFDSRVVEYIISNPIYKGYYRWNASHHTGRKFDDPDTIIVKSCHDPIVSDELWDAAQKRRASIKAVYKCYGKPSENRHHWMCGIVRCASCGATLVFARPHYLICCNYSHGKCMTSQHISIELLEEAFLSRLRADLSPGSDPAFHLVDTVSGSQEAEDRRRIENIHKKIDRLTAAYLAEAMDLDDYKKFKADLEAEEVSLKDKLASDKKKTAPKKAAATLRTRISQTLSILYDPDATTAEKYNSANSIIEKAIFDKSSMTLTITYRLLL